MQLASNGTASASLSLPAIVKLTVRARGDQCSGAPQMVVSIDGAQRLSAAVSSTSFTDYAASFSLAAGTHSVVVRCQNVTTGQSVNLPLSGRDSWNCATAGLTISPGDSIVELLIGSAD